MGLNQGKYPSGIKEVLQGNPSWAAAVVQWGQKIRPLLSEAGNLSLSMKSDF